MDLEARVSAAGVAVAMSLLASAAVSVAMVRLSFRSHCQTNNSQLTCKLPLSTARCFFSSLPTVFATLTLPTIKTLTETSNVAGGTRADVSILRVLVWRNMVHERI